MAPKKSLLEKMRANPKADWAMSDVETLCSECGLLRTKPRGGSHYLVSSPYIPDLQCVPFNRPIKTIYIKKLVRLADQHLAEHQLIKAEKGERG